MDNKNIESSFIKCPHCNGEHQSGAKFCTKTGIRIKDPAIQDLFEEKSALKDAVVILDNKNIDSVNDSKGLYETVDMKLSICSVCSSSSSKPNAKFCKKCGSPLLKSEDTFAPLKKSLELTLTKNEKQILAEDSIAAKEVVTPVNYSAENYDHKNTKPSLLIDTPLETPNNQEKESGKKKIKEAKKSSLLVCSNVNCKEPVSKKDLYCKKCYTRVVLCPNCENVSDPFSSLCTFCGSIVDQSSRDWTMLKGGRERVGLSLSFLKPPLKRLWVYPDSKNRHSILSSPVVYRGIVFYGSCDKNLHAINQYTGSGLWKRPCKGFVVSTPAVHDGIIYYASTDGKVFASDVKKGIPIWNYPVRKKETLGCITASMLVCDSGVVTVDNNGTVYCLDKNSGKLLWKRELDNEGCCPAEENKKINDEDSYLEAFPSPAYGEGRLFIPTLWGRIFCLEENSGKVLWTFPKDKARPHKFLAAPSVAAGHCYIPDRSGNLFSLDIHTGEDTWAYTVETESVVEGSPATGFSKLLIGTQNHYLIALNLNTGGEIWRKKNDKIRLEDSILSTPVITKDRLIYYGSISGRLYCINLEDGQFLWSDELDSPIRSCFAVSDGILYVTTQKGHLCAYSQKK